MPDTPEKPQDPNSIKWTRRRKDPEIIDIITDAAKKVGEQEQSSGSDKPALTGDASKATQENIDKRGKVWEDDKKKK